MTRFFCAALILLGVAACDEATSPSMTRVPAATPTTGQPTRPRETAASATSTPPTTLAGRCGVIAVSGAPPRVVSDRTAALNSLQCFAQAYASCSDSALTIADTSVGTTRQFTTQRVESRCVVRQALQTDPSSPPAVADCAGVRLENDTLVIESCSHLGDFSLTP